VNTMSSFEDGEDLPWAEIGVKMTTWMQKPAPIAMTLPPLVICFLSLTATRAVARDGAVGVAPLRDLSGVLTKRVEDQLSGHALTRFVAASTSSASTPRWTFVAAEQGAANDLQITFEVYGGETRCTLHAELVDLATRTREIPSPLVADCDVSSLRASVDVLVEDLRRRVLRRPLPPSVEDERAPDAVVATDVVARGLSTSPPAPASTSDVGWLHIVSRDRGRRWNVQVRHAGGTAVCPQPVTNRRGCVLRDVPRGELTIVYSFRGTTGERTFVLKGRSLKVSIYDDMFSGWTWGTAGGLVAGVALVAASQGDARSNSDNRGGTLALGILALTAAAAMLPFAIINDSHGISTWRVSRKSLARARSQDKLRLVGAGAVYDGKSAAAAVRFSF
jgi:hypothetical protein